MTGLTKVLGPHLRYVLWVQGCPHNCYGCIAKQTHDPTLGEEKSICELSHDILQYHNIEGLTISGGEPFEQALELSQLLIHLKQQRDLGVIVYTGYRLEELLEKAKHNPSISMLLDAVDLLIDGRYLDELNDNLSLRGSSNQQIIALTSRYEQVIQTHYGKPGRKIEIQVMQKTYQMIGIPAKEYEKMKAIILNRGDDSNE